MGGRARKRDAECWNARLGEWEGSHASFFVSVVPSRPRLHSFKNADSGTAQIRAIETDVVRKTYKERQDGKESEKEIE